MFSLSTKPASSVRHRRRVPFRIRLVAWWEGYEVRYKDRAEAKGESQTALKAPPLDMSPPTEEEKHQTLKAGGTVPESLAAEAPAVESLDPPKNTPEEPPLDSAESLLGLDDDGNDAYPEEGDFANEIPLAVGEAIKHRLEEMKEEVSEEAFVNAEKLVILNQLDQESDITEAPRNGEENNRADAVQALWGTGYSAPESKSFLDPISAPLALRAGQKILFLGAGTGGVVRRWVREHQVTIDGADLCQALSDRGDEISQSQDMDRTAGIQLLSLEKPHFRPHYYDVAIVKEILQTLKDISPLFSELRQAMKAESQMLVFAYVQTENSQESHRATLAHAEGEMPQHFLTAQALQHIIEQAGFVLYHSLMQGDPYCDEIRKGLDQSQSDVEQEAVTAAFQDIVTKERALWQGRLAALEAKDLDVACLYFKAIDVL